MMQSRTSFAIILPETQCFLPLGLSSQFNVATVDGKEATVRKKSGGHKLELSRHRID